MNRRGGDITDRIYPTSDERGYLGAAIKRWTRHAVRSTVTWSMGIIPLSQWCSRTTSNCPCTTTDTFLQWRLLRNARCLRYCPPRVISPRGGCRVQGLPGPCLGPCDYHAESERYVKSSKVFNKKLKKRYLHHLRQWRREDLCRGSPHTQKPNHQYIVSRVSKGTHLTNPCWNKK